MAFLVNEDRPTNSAKIHRGDCLYGVPSSKKSQDGRWHGPFAILEEAKQAARNTRFKVDKCKVCNPW